MIMSAEAFEFPDEGHFVHLYGTDLLSLGRSAAAFMAEGLMVGHSVLAIVGPENWDVIAAELERRGVDVGAARGDGSITLLDASATLATFTVDGVPDRARFDATVASAIREAVRRDPGVRLYGEMVGLLWSAGDAPAAILLEKMWNELLESVSTRLFCSYPIDIFGDDFHPESVDGIMCAHSHLLPAAGSAALAKALDLGMDAVLGVEGARSIKPLIQPNHRPAWGSMPEAEATILWLRNNLPKHADEITAVAREYFRE